MTELYGSAYCAVLFDLDGTLVDTAPDMVAVLQRLQEAHGREPLAYENGRMQVSNGAIGLLSVGFPDIEIETGGALHLEFLERYADCICESSVVFPYLADLLTELDDIECPWGVVTNKPESLTLPLMNGAGTR